MTALCFVDTSVLVYSRDASEPQKQPRALEWREQLWRRHAGRLSVQVLNEYYQVVTRKLVPGMPREQARAEVLDLTRWRPVPLNAALVESAFDVEDRWKTSWWDALVIAAALQAGCTYLLSEDLSDGQALDGLTIVNPFRVEPSELLDG